jgi:excisionase family DNA binding protein
MSAILTMNASRVRALEVNPNSAHIDASTHLANAIDREAGTVQGRGYPVGNSLATHSRKGAVRRQRKQIMKATLPDVHPVLLLKAADAARALAISERKLWDLTKCGEIPTVRIGRSVRYAPADLENWIITRKRPAEQA